MKGGDLMTEVQVLLGEQQAEALQNSIYKIISNAVETARRDTGLDKKFLKKKDATKYAGISLSIFSSFLIKYNIPVHYIDGIQLISKQDIDSFIISQ